MEKTNKQLSGSTHLWHYFGGCFKVGKDPSLNYITDMFITLTQERVIILVYHWVFLQFQGWNLDVHRSYTPLLPCDTPPRNYFRVSPN